jgi:ABC-type uncharacterized transport system permease subunit
VIPLQALVMAGSLGALLGGWEAARRCVAGSKQATRWMLRGAVAALLLTSLSLANEFITRGSFPLETLADALLWFSTTPLIAALAVYGVARSVWPALLLLPLAGLAQAGSLFCGRLVADEAARRALGGPLLGVHVGLFLAGYSAVIISGGLAVVYLVLDRRLKKSHVAAIWDDGAPPLAKLDRSLVLSAGVGVVLWGLGIALAFALLGRQSSIVAGPMARPLLTDMTVLSSFAVWLYFTAFVALRRRLGWVGRRAATVVLVGVALLLASYGAGKLQGGRSLHGFSVPRAATAEVVR